MPHISVRNLNQTAVLWAYDGDVNDYGRPTGLAEPVQIPVRWEWGKRELMDPKGGTVAYDALAVVDRVIPHHSRMWLGTLADLPGTGFVPESDAMEVKDSNETPDIKGRHYRRTVSLARHSDAPPSVG